MSSTTENQQISDNKQYKRPQYCYIREPVNAPPGKERRFIAVAMTYDQEGNVEYGAAIFRREKNDDLIVRKKLRETAEKRFASKPVKIKVSKDELPKKLLPKPKKETTKTTHTTKTTNKPEKTFKYEEVLYLVRKSMFKYGVCEKHQTQ